MQDYTIAKDAHGNYHLCHGVEWKNHKYIKKIGKGIGALYFYTPDELKRYLQNVAKTAQQTGQNIKTAGQEVAKKMQLNSETANAAKTKVQEASQRAQTSSRRIAKEAQTGAQAAAKTVKQTAARAASEVKRAVKEPKSANNSATRAKSAVEKLNNKTKLTPHTPLTLSSNAADNQAQLSNAKKDEDLTLLADWSEGRKPSGDHGLTSHGRKTGGTAKDGWSKKRELPSSLEESSELLGGKTAMGKDYIQETFKSALQQYAKELDDIRVTADNFQSLKDIEFEMARTKELNEDLKQQLSNAKDNLVQNTLHSGPSKSIGEIQKLRTELKNNERSLKALEQQHKELQKYYDETMADFETLLEYYKDIYM